jgi:DNA mismatch repair protein MutS
MTPMAADMTNQDSHVTHRESLRLDQTVRGDYEAADRCAFHSILFPPGLEWARAQRSEEPGCFVDLNLDQVVAAIVARRDEAFLRPLFYSPYRSEQIVKYRQAVFADLEHPDVFRLFPAFCEAMRAVHIDVAYAKKISAKRHRHMVTLLAVSSYCEAVARLLGGLKSLPLQSAGLRNLRAYLAAYAGSGAFARLAAEAQDLKGLLSQVNYSMLFHGDKVTVRKYALEPDYAATILERFAKFRRADAEAATSVRPVESFSLNHIEEGILEFVGRLFPDQFRLLEDFAALCVGGFVDDVLATFEREIGFFLAYLAFINPLKKADLPFCHPIVSAFDKTTKVSASFDLALAAKLVGEKRSVVCNDFTLSGAERLIVASGPNQGGKTTFARMFGQLHFLAGLGCPVPGADARLFLPDQVFTHFEREEDIANLRGKLEDDLVRLHESCCAMTADSAVILNEIFNSTSLDDQVFLSTNVLGRILAIDAIGVCVTFIDSLTTLSEKTVSMVATVDPKDLAHRTFKLARMQADGLAYALSLAEKRGVTYDQLRLRVQQ